MHTSQLQCTNPLTLSRKLVFALFFTTLWSNLGNLQAGIGLGVLADRNVTVDDLNTQLISYSSGWSEASFANGFQYGGSHAFSLIRGSTATFTFTGTAVYYLAPGWPYTVNTQLTLDSGNPEVVFLVDPNHSAPPGGPPSSASVVRWQRTGLANTTHTVVASMWESGSFIVVDAFIFTVPDSTSSSSTTLVGSPSSSGASPASTSGNPSSVSSTAKPVSSSNPGFSPSPQNRAKKSSATATIVGAVLGALVALLLVAILFLLARRRRKQTAFDARNNRSEKSNGVVGAGAYKRGSSGYHMETMDSSEGGPFARLPPRGYEAGAPAPLMVRNAAPLSDRGSTQPSSPSPPSSNGIGHGEVTLNNKDYDVPPVWNPSAGGYPYGGPPSNYDLALLAAYQQQQQQQYAQDAQLATQRRSLASSGSLYSGTQELTQAGSPHSPHSPRSGSSREQWSPGYEGHLGYPTGPGYVQPDGPSGAYDFPVAGPVASLQNNDMVRSGGGTHFYGERLSTVLEGSQYSGATSPRSDFVTQL